jgi:hypothetical protein
MLNTTPLSRCAEHDHPEPCPVCAADRQESTAPAQPTPPGAKFPRRPFSDRDLAIVVRSALLAIVKGIEQRYDIKPKQVN